MPRPKKNTTVLNESNKEAHPLPEKKRSPRKKKEEPVSKQPIVEQVVPAIIVETKPFDNTVFSSEIFSEQHIQEEPVQQIVEEQVQEQVIEEPIQEQVVEEPVEKVVEETIEELIVEEHIQEQVVEEPVEQVVEEHIQEQVVEEPVEKVVEEPIQEHVVEEPIQEQVVEEPVEQVVEEPIQEQVVEEPIQEQVVEEPVVIEISVEQPIQEKIIEEPPPNLDEEVCQRLKECSSTIKNQISNSEEKTEEILEELINNNNISMKIKKVHFEENHDWKYSMKDLTMLFGQFNEAFMIIQKKGGRLRYIEKKGYETRNSSVIDLLIETDKAKPLPDFQIAVFTNDELKKDIRQKNPYIFTFCNNDSDINPLFPNFNFNHWIEAGIGAYDEYYKKHSQNPIPWEEKKDIIFWSGSNTSKIREKIFVAAQNNKHFLINLILKNQNPIKYYPIDSHSEFKYLLNMNGNSYAGRLNYLFMSGSCVIILKNKNTSYQWNEFFTKEFIPNEDFIEVDYDDNTPGPEIVKLIEEKISILNGEQIAKSGFIKAVQQFNRENIYNYIHKEISRISEHLVWDVELKSTIEFLPASRLFLNNRLEIIEKKMSTFKYLGYHLELLVFLESSNPSVPIREINILLRNTEIFIMEKSNIIQRKNISWLSMQNIYHEYSLLIIPEIKQLVLQVDQKMAIGNVKLIDSLENPNEWTIKNILIRNLEKVGKLIH